MVVEKKFQPYKKTLPITPFLLERDDLRSFCMSITNQLPDFKPLEAYKETIPFIRKLCNDKSEKELVAIEENFRKFLCLVYRIARRIGKQKELKGLGKNHQI